jgi:hypothetical protein
LELDVDRISGFPPKARGNDDALYRPYQPGTRFSPALTRSDTLVTSGDEKMPPSIEKFQQRVANITIGASTLRNQGTSGVNEAVRSFLKEIELTKFVSDNEADFIKHLDYQTDLLTKCLPAGAQH